MFSNKKSKINQKILPKTIIAVKGIPITNFPYLQTHIKNKFYHLPVKTLFKSHFLFVNSECTKILSSNFVRLSSNFLYIFYKLLFAELLTLSEFFNSKIGYTFSCKVRPFLCELEASWEVISSKPGIFMLIYLLLSTLLREF